MRQSNEQILKTALKGIQALAYTDNRPVREIMDRIRITCKQTLELVE